MPAAACLPPMRLPRSKEAAVLVIHLLTFHTVAFIADLQGDTSTHGLSSSASMRSLCLRVQVPEAHGRYICSHSSTISTKTLSDILQKRFPQYKFPAGDDQPSKEVWDNSKVRRLISKGCNSVSIPF